MKNILINNRFHKEIKLTAIASFLVCASVANATDYTSTVTVNGTTREFQDGDTITTTSGHGINASNSGIVTIQNPLTDSITINAVSQGIYAQTSSSITLGTVDITGGNSGMNISGGSSVTIGNNSQVKGTAQYGVVLYGDIGSSFSAGDDLYLTTTTGNALRTTSGAGGVISIGDRANIMVANNEAIYLTSGGTLTIGSNATISTGSGNAIRASNGSNITIGDYANITGNYYSSGTEAVAKFGKNTLINGGISVATGSKISFGNNATIINASGDAVYVTSDGKIDLGSGANIISTGGVALRATGSGSEIIASDATLTGSTYAVKLGPTDCKITLINSDMTGSLGGATFENSNNLDTQSELNIIGGSLTALSGAVFNTADNATRVGGIVINISDGAKINAVDGIIIDSTRENASSTVDINISGVGTEIEGSFNRDGGLNVSVSDGATWASKGDSNIENLVLTDAIVEVNFGDTITTGNLTLEGNNQIEVTFTDDLLHVVGDTYDFDITSTIVSSITDGSGSIDFVLKDRNEGGSTWDIIDLGGGYYRIENIHIIPEPATYVMIFGVLALGFAVYRRRK